MSSYLNLLYHNFGFNIWLTLILLIIGCSAILFIIFMSIILFLDSIYRPSASQYPFNVILDRIIPFIALFCPSLIIFFFHPLETWFARMTLLIAIHIFVLVPTFHYWSKLRSWHDKKDDISYSSWSHPRLYSHIAIALIYPLIWGLYLSCSRFLRLGSTYNIIDNFHLLNPEYIILFFLFPYLIFWLFLLFFCISQFRKYLWNLLYTLFYSIHIKLLQYYFYFRIMEIIFKVVFFVECALTLNINRKNYKPWWQQIINYLFYNPIWFTIMIFTIIIAEIVLTKKIHYGVYILFFFPFIRSLFSCFFSYGNTNFVFDCCYSDYITQRDNFKSLRYPINFWNYFRDAKYHFGFEYEYTEEQKKEINIEMNKRTSRWLLCKKRGQDVHQDIVNLRIRRKPHSTFCLRMAANYQHMNRVRWVHTERVLHAVTKYHTCSALFAKSIFDKIVLLNNNWTNLHHIQAARTSTEIPLNMYKTCNQTFYPIKKDFIHFQD